MSDNNPLKQYFRRPTVFLRLPSGGKHYPYGTINIPDSGELPVYPMTAIDEITAKTPDALFNGVAMSELIKSCIPDIKDPWVVNSIDLDAILIAIRAASGGNEMELESQCPACNETSTYGINLLGILSQLRAGDYDTEMQVNDLQIKFRPLTYKEMNQASLGQFEIQKMYINLENVQDENERNKLGQEALTAITSLTMKLLTEAIEYIQTPTTRVDNKDYIMDFLKNCDKNTYVSIRDHNAALKSQTEIKPLDIKCVNCNHKYMQQFTLNTSDFFG